MPTERASQPDLLELTLARAKKDQETVRAGIPLGKLLDGMSVRESVTHLDDRGSVTELFDPRWGWHPDPVVFAYMFTIRPGAAKGWGLHKLHEDRYFVIHGEMELIAFDPRRESSTYGKVCRVMLSANQPRLINIPKFVCHADRNLSDVEVKVINFPTTQYDHASPDKYRLPLDTDLIPFDLSGSRGW